MADHLDAAKRSRAGRRPSAVWDFFSPMRSESNTLHAQCVFCSRRCAGVASRMTRHIVSKCPAATPEAIHALSDGTGSSSKKRRTADRASVVSSVVPAALVPPQEPLRASDTSATHVTTPPPASPAAEELTEDEDDAGAGDREPEPEAHGAEQPLAVAASASALSELQAAIAHQKLVLACVLNDIPLRFVEDEALVDALLALRPDFPRLTAEAAQTQVLDELCRAADHRVADALVHAEHFAVLHRQQRSSGLWLGRDGFREPLLLAETPRSSGDIDNSSSKGTTETMSDAEPLLLEALAVLSAQLSRLPTTAVLSVCTDDTELSQRLRALQRDEQGTATTNGALEMPLVADDMETSEHAAVDPRLRAALVGTCLLRQTLLLQTQLLALVPAIVTVLQDATTLVCAVVNEPRASTSLRSTLLGLVESDSDNGRGSGNGRGSAGWSLPTQVVRCLVALEDDVRSEWTRTPTLSLPAPRPAFWDDLRRVDALLAPFSWACALSESDAGDVTSAQFLLLWLWLLSLAHAPSLSLSSSATVCFSTEQRAALTAATVAAIRVHAADHQLASLLLDSRVHGAGLSATGKRKAKALVVHVAVRVFPAAGFHAVGSEARTSLLAQLGSYADKTAQFADDVAWEMSAGQPAASFWKDYAEDARELADVARAAVQFVPHVQSASAMAAARTGAGDSDSVSAHGADDREAFRVRQIKQLYQKTAGGPRASASADAAVARYARLLLPIERDVVTAATRSSWDALASERDSATTGTTAAHILLAMTQQIAFLRSADGRVVTESERSPREDGRVSGENDASAATGATTLSAVDESWFAFRSASDRREIERALERFAPPAMSTRRSSRQ